MTSMLLATIVQTALLATGADSASLNAETYADARQSVTESGKPMIVMVSTEWCPPCQTMKKTVMPQVREKGLLKKVIFAIVNPDRDHDLAERLTGGGPIPQLLMFRKKGDGWVRKKLVGGQSVETVEEFIKEGLAQDGVDQKSSEAAEKSDLPSDRTAHRDDAADDDATKHG